MIKHISSRDNPLFKEFKALAQQAQARRKAGLCLLEGTHLCLAALQQKLTIQHAVLAQASLDHPEIQAMLNSYPELERSLLVLENALFANLSQVENGIGLVFFARRPVPELPAQISQTAVVLDVVQDPGNMGSILRSAAAAGIRQVYCAPGSASAWSPKVLRAGMGAHFLLEIFEQVDLARLLTASHLPRLATSSHTRTTIYQANLAQAVIWMFGHEGQGLSAELLALATQTVTIPQHSQLESMNVAASAAVCFFEQVRQLHHS